MAMDLLMPADEIRTGLFGSGCKWTSRFFLPSLHCEHRFVRQLRLDPPRVWRDIGVRPAPIRFQARGPLRSRHHRAQVLVVAVLKESRNAFLENLKPVAHELSVELVGHPKGGFNWRTRIGFIVYQGRTPRSSK